MSWLSSLFHPKKPATTPEEVFSMIGNAQLPQFNANMSAPQNFWTPGVNGSAPQFNIPNFWPAMQGGQAPQPQGQPDIAALLASLQNGGKPAQ